MRQLIPIIKMCRGCGEAHDPQFPDAHDGHEDHIAIVIKDLAAYSKIIGKTIYPADGYTGEGEHYILYSGNVFVVPIFIDMYCEAHMWCQDKLQWELTDECFPLISGIGDQKIKVVSE